MRRFVAAIESRGWTPYTPIAVAAWIAGLRILGEHLTIYLPRGTVRDPAVWYGHVTLFYLALVLCISAVLRLTTGREAARVVPAVGAGLVLGILPPVIDVLVYGAGQFNYTYRLDFLQTLPLLLYDPPERTPVGETVAVWASVLLVAAYARVTGASWRRVGMTVGGHYLLIILFLALIPSASFWLHATVRGMTANESVSAILLVAALVGYLTLRPALAAHVGTRLLHAILAPALVLVGSSYLGIANGDTVAAAFVMFVAALTFAVHNSYFDRKEDASQKRPGRVTRDDAVVIATLSIPLWLVFASGHFWAVAFAVLFTVVGFTYHADPFRLKCVFPLSYKTEGFFAALCIGAGMLAHPRATLGWQELAVAFLVGGGASLIAMGKDYKDVEADTAAGVRTVFVVLASRGFGERKTLLLVTGVTAVCLGVPAVWIATQGEPVTAALLAVPAALVLAAPFLIRRRDMAALASLAGVCAYLVVAADGLRAVAGAT
jgi:4-hydroxybenzoate polyprenyltransferase